MIKFKTDQKSRYGSDLILPVVGLVTVSEEGEIEVPEELVAEFELFDVGFDRNIFMAKIVTESSTENVTLQNSGEITTISQVVNTEVEKEEPKEKEEDKEGSEEEGNGEENGSESEEDVENKNAEIIAKIEELEKKKANLTRDSAKARVQEEIDDLVATLK